MRLPALCISTTTAARPNNDDSPQPPNRMAGLSPGSPLPRFGREVALDFTRPRSRVARYRSSRAGGERRARGFDGDTIEREVQADAVLGEVFASDAGLHLERGAASAMAGDRLARFAVKRRQEL